MLEKFQLTEREVKKEFSGKAPDNLPEKFAATVAQWFRRVKEDFPWRGTSDPYAVLVSEMMLQQTQVGTVLAGGYYEKWMMQFPDVGALAVADEEAVLKAWEGLGYYRRARNLKRTAEQVRDFHGGIFPDTVEELQKLPGVGRYTAGAVLSFAFGKPAPIVDANVARVFARLFDLREEIDSSQAQRQLWAWASDLVPVSEVREYNAGLMELGQKICTPSRPKCESCPVATWCACDQPENLPKKKIKRPVENLKESVFFARRQDGKFLVERETGARRTGLFRLPLTGEEATGWPVLLETKYCITRYRVTLTCFAAPDGFCPPVETDDDRIWCLPEEAELLPVATPYRKVLRKLLHEPTLDA